MKRFGLFALIVLAGSSALPPRRRRAQAGLFGGKKAASPSPSPSPSALADGESGAAQRRDSTTGRKVEGESERSESTLAQLAAAISCRSIGRTSTLQYTQHLLQMGDKTAQVYYYDGFAHEQLGQLAAGDLRSRASLESRSDQPGRARAAVRHLSQDEPVQRRRAHRQTRRDVQQDRPRRADDARQRLRRRAALRRRARPVRSGLRAQSQRYGTDLSDRDDVRAAE